VQSFLGKAANQLIEKHAIIQRNIFVKWKCIYKIFLGRGMIRLHVCNMSFHMSEITEQNKYHFIRSDMFPWKATLMPKNEGEA